MKNLPTFTLWCWCKAGRTTLSHRKVRSNDSVSPSSLYHNHHHHCFPSARHKLLSWPISPLCPSQWKYSLGHISIRYTSLMQKCFATSRLQQCNCSNISCFTVCHTVGFIWLHLRIITIKENMLFVWVLFKIWEMFTTVWGNHQLITWERCNNENYHICCL